MTFLSPAHSADRCHFFPHFGATTTDKAVVLLRGTGGGGVSGNEVNDVGGGGGGGDGVGAGPGAAGVDEALQQYTYPDVKPMKKITVTAAVSSRIISDEGR